jgi:uncharacterized protein YjbI with pentapeptide repeats
MAGEGAMSMSEQQPLPANTAAEPMPAPEGYSSWNDYWTKQHNLPWRTEPEINEDRQQLLAERRSIMPDSEQGIYPFKDFKLDRADVEWLLATHESGGMRGPVDWSDPKQRGREGLDVRGADLREANLVRLPLACLRAGLRFSELHFLSTAQPELEMPPGYEATAGLLASVVHLEQARLDGAHLENACLHQARLDDAHCRDAHLEGVLLLFAHLDGAEMFRTHLEDAFAASASFKNAQILEAHCERANLLWADFSGAVLVGTHLEDADLSRVTFSDATILNGAWLGSRDDGLLGLHDVRWGGADVALVHWVKERRRRRRAKRADGDGRQGTHLREGARVLQGQGPQDEASAQLLADRRALRANRQIALLLRTQGLHEAADRLAYRAQVLQLRVLRREHHPLRYVGSQVLNLISGYGYRPMRSLITYALVVLCFAAAYYLLGNNVSPALDPHGAIVFSLTSFHGRGFSPGGNLSPDNPLTTLAAVEAVLGLLIEITFIATFTQRFFAR